MNPALKPILAAIESAVVRIEYARDDEHALNEAIQLAAEVRSLLRVLGERVAFTEADPVPLRNCDTCAHDYTEGTRRLCAVIHKDGGPTWEWANANTNPFMGGAPKPDADNCPGYTLRLTDSAGRNTGST